MNGATRMKNVPSPIARNPTRAVTILLPHAPCAARRPGTSVRARLTDSSASSVAFHTCSARGVDVVATAGGTTMSVVMRAPTGMAWSEPATTAAASGLGFGSGLGLGFGWAFGFDFGLGFGLGFGVSAEPRLFTPAPEALGASSWELPSRLGAGAGAGEEAGGGDGLGDAAGADGGLGDAAGGGGGLGGGGGVAEGGGTGAGEVACVGVGAGSGLGTSSAKAGPTQEMPTATTLRSTAKNDGLPARWACRPITRSSPITAPPSCSIPRAAEFAVPLNALCRRLAAVPLNPLCRRLAAVLPSPLCRLLFLPRVHLPRPESIDPRGVDIPKLGRLSSRAPDRCAQLLRGRAARLSE